MKKSLNIATFVRQVIGELNKVSWPSRQETMLATLMVVVFSFVMSLFLLLSDQLIAKLIRWTLGN